MGKLRLGLTQRVEVFGGYSERRDCLDQEWSSFLSGLDITPIPLPNRLENVSETIECLKLDGVIFTGGNDIQVNSSGANFAPERDALERTLLAISVATGFKIFGVCRGLQMLVSYYGGKVQKCDGHCDSRHEVFQTPSDGRSVIGLPDSTCVNSYHKFCVFPEDVPDCLEILCSAEDGTVEALRHRVHDQMAVMWHPERQPRDGHSNLIFNFFSESAQS